MNKKSLSVNLFDNILYVFLSFAILIVLYPLYFIVIGSFSDPLQVIAGKVWAFPKSITFEPYRMVFRDSSIWVGYRNTIFYTIGGTFLNLIMTLFAAYPLSKKGLKGGSLIMKLMVLTIYFGGGLIPTYLLISSLGMINTYWAMVIPNAVAVWNIIITRTYFTSSIPIELEEAAYIDGSSHFNTFIKIILPLSKPIISVMILFYGVAHWNSFFNGLIYLNDKSRFPLQLILRGILIQNQASEDMLMGIDDTYNRKLLAETMKYALIIVSTAPVLCLYPFLQKYFIKGILIGSIKG